MAPARGPAAAALTLLLLARAQCAGAAGGVRTAPAPPPPGSSPGGEPGGDSQVSQEELLELAFQRLPPPRGEPPAPSLSGDERREVSAAAAQRHLAKCMHNVPPACGPRVHPQAPSAPEEDGMSFDHLHFIRPTRDAPPHEGAMVCAPPKVGSTGFDAILWRMFALGEQEDLKGHFIHTLPKEVREVQTPLRKAIREGMLKPAEEAPTRLIASQRPLRISFVRSPYTRAYSAWLDKLADCSSAASDEALCLRMNRELAELAEMQDSLTETKRELTWPEFTKAMAKVSAAGATTSLNGHFALQVNLCRIDHVGYDLIAPAETGFAGAERIFVRWLFPDKGADFVDRVTASGRVLNSAAGHASRIEKAALRHDIPVAPEDIWTKQAIADLQAAYAEDLAAMPWYQPPHVPR
eukprot:TRINITY_DN895_c0_g1_i1.p1 TRINITY_DN895_c0_g1~~TRINITY_DN895_c0_g1_i1.p1  ORF type:complete len:441 (+),score=142.53 TRINITY_DN895_c0_g1_i1:99-1325(+)